MQLRTWRARATTLALLVSLGAVPLTMARASEPAPEGIPTMLKYAGCALGIAIGRSPQAIAVALFSCIQMYNEAQW